MAPFRKLDPQGPEARLKERLCSAESLSHPKPGTVPVPDFGNLLARYDSRPTLLNRHKLPCVMPNPDLPRAGDFLFGISKHLLPLRQPSNGSGNGEEHGKHLWLEPHGFVHDSGIEIDVGIELAAHEIIVFESDALQFHGYFDFRIAARDFEELVGGPLDDLRARIVVLVNAVSESHQLALAFFNLLDVGGDIFFGTNLVEHFENFFVGATVERSG